MKINMSKTFLVYELFVLSAFLVIPQKAFAEDGFTTFTYTVVSYAKHCSIQPAPVSGVQCHITCNLIDRYGVSDSNGKCEIKFPKSECKIGDKFNGYPGPMPCSETPSAYQSWLAQGFGTDWQAFTVFSDNISAYQGVDTSNSVPEFGVFTSVFATLGSLGGFLLMKNKSKN
jgi:hypothetical protein